MYQMSQINNRPPLSAIPRMALCGFWVLSFILLTLNPSFAKDSASPQRWTFAPDVGFEGEAAISDGKLSRMEMECGNGGGPAIEVESPEIKEIAVKGRDDFYLLQFEIDGNRIAEEYNCYQKSSICLSFGFPSIKLTTALRQGANVIISYEKTVLAKFSLAGSYAAINGLFSCLGPENY